MWLLQEAGVDQIGHYVANSCWTETILMMPGQGARTHWLTCGDVSLDNGGEDLPFTGTDLSWGRHNLGTPKFFRCRNLDIRFNSHLHVDCGILVGYCQQVLSWQFLVVSP